MTKELQSQKRNRAAAKIFIGKPADFGQQKKDDYTAHHYHQMLDEVGPDWDLSGAVQDVDLLFEVGYQVANGVKFPEWRCDPKEIMDHAGKN